MDLIDFTTFTKGWDKRNMQITLDLQRKELTPTVTDIFVIVYFSQRYIRARQHCRMMKGKVCPKSLCIILSACITADQKTKTRYQN